MHLRAHQYIAIERLESTYKSCGLISNICVHATTDAKQPMAIIFPHEANLRQALQKNNLVSASDAKDADLSTLLAEKKIQNLVLKETNAVGKRAGLKQLET